MNEKQIIDCEKSGISTLLSVYIYFKRIYIYLYLETINYHMDNCGASKSYSQPKYGRRITYKMNSSAFDRY